MAKNSRTITCRDNEADIAEAIKMPNSATLDDGRKLLITKWAPVVEVDDIIHATIEGYIEIDG